MMLKAVTIKGITLGLIAGLITALFDGFFMLIPNIYVPYSYPLLLISFNTGFWIVVGGVSGLFLWMFARNREGFYEKENFYWIFFFLLPFAIIYGGLGRIFISPSTTMKTASPVFDHHLSFLWVLLVFLCVIVFKKKLITGKFHSAFFLPELVTVIMLFTFCSNIAPKIRMPVISYFLDYVFLHFKDLIFQNTQPGYKEYSTTVYIIGVVLILGCYSLTFVKKRFFSNKKESHVIVVLFLISALSLTAFFMINHNRFMRYNYPSIATKKVKETKKIPYIILIVLDTVRADRLSVYGPHGLTKNLELFAMDSLVFENCVASSSWTLPSHASLFTGLYPIEHGSYGDLNEI
jgi:hypothetical protein